MQLKIADNGDSNGQLHDDVITPDEITKIRIQRFGPVAEDIHYDRLCENLNTVLLAQNTYPSFSCARLVGLEKGITRPSGAENRALRLFLEPHLVRGALHETKADENNAAEILQEEQRVYEEQKNRLGHQETKLKEQGEALETQIKKENERLGDLAQRLDGQGAKLEKRRRIIADALKREEEEERKQADGLKKQMQSLSMRSVIERWKKCGISPRMIMQNPDILADGFRDVRGATGLFDDLLAEIKRAPKGEKADRVYLLALEIVTLEVELGQPLIKEKIVFDKALLTTATETEEGIGAEPEKKISANIHNGTIAERKKRAQRDLKITPELLARRTDILDQYLREMHGIRDIAKHYRRCMHAAANVEARIELARELINEIEELKGNLDSARDNPRSK